MNVDFEPDDPLDRLEIDRAFTAGLPREVVRAYRMRLQQLRAFRDEGDLEHSLALEPQSHRSGGIGTLSILLVDKWRLFLRLQGRGPRKSLRVLHVAHDERKTRRP